MKIFQLTLLALVSPLISQAASNSKGKESPVVVGTLSAISDDGKSFTVKQHGNIERKLLLSGKAEVEYIGIPDEKGRKLTIGYGVKAKVTPGGSEGDAIKSIRLTQPLTPAKPLGAERFTMTAAQIHAAADGNHDGKLSYVEFAASIFRSEKHGPDHFAGADADHDGSLSVTELGALLPSIDWWKFSRQPAEAWFKAADKDGSGSISLKEFEFLATGKNHVEAQFKRADSNHNGALDPAEVAAYVKGVVEKLNGDD